MEISISICLVSLKLSSTAQKQEQTRVQCYNKGMKYNFITETNNTISKWDGTVVMVSFSCQLDILGKREPQMRNLLHQTGLSACL